VLQKCKYEGKGANSETSESVYLQSLCKQVSLFAQHRQERETVVSFSLEQAEVGSTTSKF